MFSVTLLKLLFSSLRKSQWRDKYGRTRINLKARAAADGRVEGYMS